MSESRNNLFPIFLKSHELNILIVGGGNVGYEKLFFLLKSSPETKVTLVAESILDEIWALSKGKANVTLIEKTFQTGHLWNKDLVIAATNSRATNKIIMQASQEKEILVNVADTPDLCDFYLGGIVTKGDLKIAISTNGKSPTFTKRFRQTLEEVLPDSIPEILVDLRTIRDELKGDFGNKVRKLNEITSVLVRKV